MDPQQACLGGNALFCSYCYESFVLKVMLMYVSLSCTLLTSSFLSFLYTVENSTVTLYGRGFVKFNVAVWCGFSYNDTYRLGKCVFCYPFDSQSGENKTKYSFTAFIEFHRVFYHTACYKR